MEFLLGLIFVEVALVLACCIVLLLFKIREVDHKFRGLPRETPPNTGR